MCSFELKWGLTIIRLRVWFLTGNRKKKFEYSVLLCLTGMPNIRSIMSEWSVPGIVSWQTVLKIQIQQSFSLYWRKYLKKYWSTTKKCMIKMAIVQFHSSIVQAIVLNRNQWGFCSTSSAVLITCFYRCKCLMFNKNYNLLGFSFSVIFFLVKHFLLCFFFIVVICLRTQNFTA